MHSIFLFCSDHTTILGKHVLATRALLPTYREMDLRFVVEDGDMFAEGLGRMM